MNGEKLGRALSAQMVAFAVLAIGITWSGSLVGLLLSQPAFSSQMGPYVQFLRALSTLSAFGPALAGLAVAALTQGKAGLRTLAQHLFRVQFRAGWLALAALLPLVVHALGAGLDVARGMALPDLARLAGAPWLPALLQAFLLGGLAQEPGWRGYLLPETQSRHDSATSSVIVGLVWALWQLPGYFGRTAPLGGLGVAHVVALYASLALIHTWIWDNTQSVLPAILLHTGHSLCNALIATRTMRWSVVIIYVAVALLIVRKHDGDRFVRAVRASDREDRTERTGPSQP